jgi:uncharacterized protein
LVPSGRQVIQSYRGGVFRISDVEYAGPVIVFPDRTMSWDVSYGVESLVYGDFSVVYGAETAPPLIVLGCGPAMKLPPAALRKSLKDQGISIEPMDTGAACRTFNVLMGEDRRVCAALLPMPA